MNEYTAPWINHRHNQMSGVLGWGKAIYGQLGLKGQDIDAVKVPQQIPNLRGSEIKDVACGENHTLVCLQDGSLYSCGFNDYYQLGHDKSTKRFGRYFPVILCNLIITVTLQLDFITFIV